MTNEPTIVVDVAAHTHAIVYAVHGRSEKLQKTETRGGIQGTFGGTLSETGERLAFPRRNIWRCGAVCKHHFHEECGELLHAGIQRFARCNVDRHWRRYIQPAVARRGQLRASCLEKAHAEGR